MVKPGGSGGALVAMMKMMEAVALHVLFIMRV
jgi:hypothetical protein